MIFPFSLVFPILFLTVVTSTEHYWVTFAKRRSALIPQTDTVNSENAPAYALAPKQALAQYAATGCFGRTFYAGSRRTTDSRP